jgi:hypothetical protein
MTARVERRDESCFGAHTSSACRLAIANRPS